MYGSIAKFIVDSRDTGARGIKVSLMIPHAVDALFVATNLRIGRRPSCLTPRMLNSAFTLIATALSIAGCASRSHARSGRR